MELEGVQIEVQTPDATQDVQTQTDAGQEPAPEKDWAKEAQKLQEILNRKDKQLNKSRAEMAELSRIKQLYEAEKNAPKPPKSEDFTDITDEVAAKMDYLNQKKAYEENLKKLQEPAKPEVSEKQYSPEFIEIAKVQFPKIEKAAAENPEFRALYQQNLALLDAAPIHLEEAVFALENPEVALLELMKSGELESLYYMPPHVAALKIAQAEMRGKQSFQRPITKASPPISTNRGTSSVKTPDTLHGHDLVKWLSS